MKSTYSRETVAGKVCTESMVDKEQPCCLGAGVY